MRFFPIFCGMLIRTVCIFTVSAYGWSGDLFRFRVLQAVMAVVSLRTTHRVVDGLAVLSLYPLSLLLVIALESIGWD